MDFSLTFFFAAEIIGTVAFALSGAMTGLKCKLDIFGVVFVAVVTALGGGCFRDLLLGRIPPAMFRDYRYLLVAVITALLTFLFAVFFKNLFLEYEERVSALNNIFDAIGLGAFAVVGVKAGINTGYGHNGFFLVFLGVTTCIGGGIIRDLFVQRLPGVLHKHVYALPCIIGSSMYLAFVRLEVSDVIAIPVVTIFIFTMRMLATKYRWNLPKAW